jgi:Na+/melibiose symporter-like transporter
MAALYFGKKETCAYSAAGDGLHGDVSTLIVYLLFLQRKKSALRIKPSTSTFQLQFKNLMKNDQWLILGVALIMFGGIVRNSVAAYYAKYYLHGGNELISPFLTTGVVASRYGDAAGCGTLPATTTKSKCSVTPSC